jgi:hypothetical protein
MRAEDQKVVAAQRAEYKEMTKGRPTPTQEECDLIKLGAHQKKSKSGAGPGWATRMMAASGGATYATRQMRAG